MTPMPEDITPKEVAAKLHKKIGGASTTANQHVLKDIREKRLAARNISAANRPIYLVASMDADQYVSGFVPKSTPKK